MARRTKAQKAQDEVIERLIAKHIQNVQIDVMDLGKISQAVIPGSTVAEMEEAIKAKIAELRKN